MQEQLIDTQLAIRKIETFWTEYEPHHKHCYCGECGMVGNLQDPCMRLIAHGRAMREVMAWVADKLGRLADLEPHAWDRSTLRELQHALTDNPLLR